MSAWTVDRRDMLMQLLTLVGAPLTAVSLSACQERRIGDTKAGGFFDKGAMATLTDIVDLMIPKTDIAGALDVGVPAFIDKLMVDWAGKTARAKVNGVLVDVEAQAQTLSGASYATLDRKGRLAALTALDTRSFKEKDKSAEGYKLFKKLVFLTYATSEQILRTYVPNPGQYHGDLSRTEYDRLVAEKSVGAQ